MSRISQKTGVAVVLALLVMNQLLRHIQTHTHHFLKLHLQFQGVVEQEVGGVLMLSHGDPSNVANIILPDMFDELYSWSLQIEHLPDAQHWMLFDLPIIQSETEESNEVALIGDTIVEAWKVHQQGIRKVIAHGTAAVLALEAVEQNSAYVQKMVLINPILPGYFPDVERILPTSREAVSQRFSDYAGEGGLSVPSSILDSWVAHYQQPAYRVLLDALSAHTLKPLQHELPVQIIWSEPNPYGSELLRQQLQRQFPAAEWFELQDCGFAPHYQCGDKLSEILAN